MGFRTLVLSLAALVSINAGCQRVEREPEPTPRETPPQPLPVAAVTPLKEAKTLLELPRAAYSAILHVDGKDLYVITPSEVAKRTGEGSFARKELNLGSAMSARHDAIVFTHEGSLRRYTWGESGPTVLQAAASPSERLAATDKVVFSLHRTPEGHSKLSVLENRKLRPVYDSSTSIATLVAKDESAYFVEECDAGFRLGSVTKDGATQFGPCHPGRTPSALSVSDSVYYYDGPKGEVRRATLSLDHEDVVARDLVCSPLHVADKAFCAYPGKIAAIRLDGSRQVELEVQVRGPVTALTTFENQLLWIEDAGEERLVVRSLPLT